MIKLSNGKTIKIGRFKEGKHNSIIDVKDVQVGMHTNNEKGNISGITIIDSKEDMWYSAGCAVINGIGEMTGLHELKETGSLSSPIVLTNTLSVGIVYNEMFDNLLRQEDSIDDFIDSNGLPMPVVAETDNSYLSLTKATPEDVQAALDNLSDKPFQQGSVGSGIGMMSFDFSAGIGTSSRVHNNYGALGVLVQANFGLRHNLTVGGKVLGPFLGKKPNKRKSGGSIIVIIAVEQFLQSSTLSRIASRAAMGIGRVGGFASTDSGEFSLAFTTSQDDRFGRDWDDDALNWYFEATVECVEEAILQSMFNASEIKGRKKRKAPKLSHTKVSSLLAPNVKYIYRDTNECD